MKHLPTELERFGRERLIHALRRWAVLFVASVLIAGLAALAVSLALPKQYRATAQLFVAPASNPSVALQQVVLGQNLATSYVQLAKAEVVLRPAMAKVNWTDLKTFRDRTNVSQVPNTFVILVSFDSDDPGRAADTSNAIADSFVSQSATVQSALQGSVSVWQPATPPTEPEAPRIVLNTALGAVGGGLIAFVLIGLLTYLDDRIKDFDQVRARLGVTPLGEVDRVTGVGSLSGKLFVQDSPNSLEAEAFRSLRTNITFAKVDKPPRSILITSALPFEGKSVLSANLALAFAQAGTPTILLDADLRRPSQHKLFKLNTVEGLTSLITGRLAVDAIGQFRVGPNLLVIPCGSIPPDPAELLASTKMTQLIQRLLGIAEGCTVIIDTSPVLAVADPMALATKVDGCLLVVDAERTSGRACRRAIERLETVNATLLGVVLNKVSRAQGYYAYNYDGPAGPLDATPTPTSANAPTDAEAAHPSSPARTADGGN
ncbi:MAG: polysaccharide biosynthesis tyrosine autokinase [Chloroflexota bacterium]